MTMTAGAPALLAPTYLTLILLSFLLGYLTFY